jgi:hypothetical protein
VASPPVHIAPQSRCNRWCTRPTPTPGNIPLARRRTEKPVTFDTYKNADDLMNPMGRTLTRRCRRSVIGARILCSAWFDRRETLSFGRRVGGSGLIAPWPHPPGRTTFTPPSYDPESGARGRSPRSRGAAARIPSAKSRGPSVGRNLDMRGDLSMGDRGLSGTGTNSPTVSARNKNWSALWTNAPASQIILRPTKADTVRSRSRPARMCRVHFGFSRTFADPGPPSGAVIPVLQGILGRSGPEKGGLHRK